MNIFLCLVILFIVLFLGLGVPFGWVWIMYPWQRPFLKPVYKPSSNSSNHLSALIKLLCEVHSWLGPGNNPITHNLQKGLWEQINYLQIEQYSCTALFSTKTEDRVWALRRLSENKTKKVQGVIYAISEHASASNEIRTLAKEILQENNEPSTNAHNQLAAYKRVRTKPTGNNSDNPVIYSETTIIHMEDGAMVKKNGDTYSVGQAGAVGPNSEASHFQMTQNIGNNLEDVDMEALGKEFETLRLELKRLSQSPEHDMAVGAIASAEIEIKRGDRSKAKEHMKQAGIWAFDVATKIGVGLATAALKTALGL